MDSKGKVEANVLGFRQFLKFSFVLPTASKTNGNERIKKDCELKLDTTLAMGDAKRNLCDF